MLRPPRRESPGPGSSLRFPGSTPAFFNARAQTRLTNSGCDFRRNVDKKPFTRLAPSRRHWGESLLALQL
jgi:hypothetical protein